MMQKITNLTKVWALCYRKSGEKNVEKTLAHCGFERIAIMHGYFYHKKVTKHRK